MIHLSKWPHCIKKKKKIIFSLYLLTNHVKGAVLLAGASAGGLDDLQEQVHGLLQHLLPLLAGGVQQGLRGRHRRHKVLENVELDPEGEKGVNFRRLLYNVKYIFNFYNKK